MNEQSQNEKSEPGMKSDCFCDGAGPRFTHKAREMRSNITAEHFRNAGVEILKGIRSVLDLGIDRLTRDPDLRGASIHVD
jgi:hypothetical protein